ncbi:hypothetical protein [Rubrivirga sp.]|uniref:hypothetical protein n=1 Tax=Rubrivirga sp. TaxID=1885344 RepID=UPI003C773E72
MTTQTLSLVALVGAVLLWIGLEVWNRAAQDRLDRLKPEIEAGMQAYLETHNTHGEVPPPNYWDFRQGRVVEFEPGTATNVQSESDDPDAPFVAVATVVDAGAPQEWPPIWM